MCNNLSEVADQATLYQPQSGEIFVAKSPEYMLEVQRTAIYFGALHLQRINLSLIYKYLAALRLSN